MVKSRQSQNTDDIEMVGGRQMKSNDRNDRK